MENLIVIEGKEKYQHKDIKSMIEGIINKRYYELSEEEKQNELEKKAIANTMLNNIQIVKFENAPKYLKENVFVLKDEITHILSLLRLNKILLLEKTEANIFGKYINKKDIEKNYIIINKYANEIMQKYLTNNLKEF